MNGFTRVLNFIKYHLPLILFSGLIFYFSSFSRQLVIEPEVFGSWNYSLRKLTHIAEYSVLFLLAWRSFGFAKIKQYVIFAAVYCFLFAISDEWHQTFVPGREGKGIDVFIDMIGVALAYLFTRFIP